MNTSQRTGKEKVDLPPETGTETSATTAQPRESFVAYNPRLEYMRNYASCRAAHEVSPFSDSQTLEYGLSRLVLSDSYAQMQQPLWNSGRSNQGFGDIQGISGGGNRVSPSSQHETEREQTSLLQRLRSQNDCVNGSYWFDVSGRSSTMMGQDRVLNNGFRNGNLGEVPFPQINSLMDQRPWGNSNGSMLGNHRLRRHNRGGFAYHPEFVHLENLDVVMFAKHRTHYDIVLKLIGLGSRECIDMIFQKLVFHICELMIDPFGHHVVKELIQKCTDEQITHILIMVTREPLQLAEICNDSHGTRAIQALLSCLRSQEQISGFMVALSRVALLLMKNTNGGHVILYCLKHFSPLDKKHLLEAATQHCYQIAIDQHGCFVLQLCVSNSSGELQKGLIGEVVSNALRLANHCYGNYVVQFVLGLDDPRAKADIMSQLEGSYTYLSQDKYGSHVVQKCLKHIKHREGSRRIVYELLRDVDMLLIDPYGNYVVQTVWEESEDDIRTILLERIRHNDQLMRCNRYGRKVLEKLHCL